MDKSMEKASKIIQMQAEMLAVAKKGLNDLIRMSTTANIGNTEVRSSVRDITSKMNTVREKYECTTY